MAGRHCTSLAPTPYEMSALALIGASNLALNGALPRRYVVPVALAGAAGTLLISRLAGVTSDQQGLAPRYAARGVKVGGLIGLALAPGTAAAAHVPPTRQFFRDERIVSAAPSTVLYELLIRMPLATALGEELMFRSALEGLFRCRRSMSTALLASAAVFGVCHVLPTLDRLQSNPGARAFHKHETVMKAAVVAAVCCATGGAAFALSWLRHTTGSIAAPIIVHYAINAGAFAGSWLAYRENEALPGTVERERLDVVDSG